MTKDEIYGNYIGKGLYDDQVDPEIAFLLEDDNEQDMEIIKARKIRDGEEIDNEEDFFGEIVETIKVDHNQGDENENIEEIIETVEDDFVKQLMEGNDSDQDNFDEKEPSSTSKMSYTMQQFLGSDFDAKHHSGILKGIPEDGSEGEGTYEAGINDEIQSNESEEKYKDLDKKSRFTEYSMTSAIMRRKEGLARLDDDFEEFYAEFDDEKLGALDTEHDIEVLEDQEENMEEEDFEQEEAQTMKILQAHLKQRAVNQDLTMDQIDGNFNDDADDFSITAKIRSDKTKIDENFKRKTIQLATQNEEEEQNDGKTAEQRVEEMIMQDYKPKEEHDVQSILSTKSNLYNRPKFVDESNLYIKRNKIKINKKGFPMDGVATFKKLVKEEKNKNKYTRTEPEDSDATPINSDDSGTEQGSMPETNMTTLTQLMGQASIRNKKESLAEKKARKALVKELKRQRREEKKNTKAAFREEGIKQARADINRQNDKNFHSYMDHSTEETPRVGWFNPMSLRNREVILPEIQNIFKSQLSQNLNFLSVAEGSGSHIKYFHPHFESWTFLPTEYQQNLVEIMEQNLNDKNSKSLPKNVKTPVILDSSNFSNWDEIAKNREFAPNNTFDIIFNVNMIHISPFSTAIGLFYGAGKYLTSGTGKLLIYGPFAFNGALQPAGQSNISFSSADLITLKKRIEWDQNLKSQSPEYGIRDVYRDLGKLAEDNGLELDEIVPMPSNNHILIYKKK